MPGAGGGGGAPISVRSAGSTTSVVLSNTSGGAGGTDSSFACAHSQCLTNPGAGSRCMKLSGWHKSTSAVASTCA